MINKFSVVILGLSVLALSACAVDEPTWVTPAKVEVHEEGFTDKFATATLDDATIRAVGVNYYRYGNGPMDLAVSYDPQSKTNNANRARQEAARIEKELARNGVHNIRVTTNPVTSSGDVSSTQISFPALTARAPETCGRMPGYLDRQTNLPERGDGPSQGYQLGCTVESLIAKQIARPGDLMGREGFETNADARRLERVVWKRGYYADVSNPPLQGEAATDD